MTESDESPREWLHKIMGSTTRESVEYDINLIGMLCWSEIMYISTLVTLWYEKRVEQATYLIREGEGLVDRHPCHWVVGVATFMTLRYEDSCYSFEVPSREPQIEMLYLYM